MNASENSPIFFFDNNDPEMQRAYARAQETFRYFWREMSWEYRRIVPALDLACVKAPFSDDEGNPKAEVEQMWVSEVVFDGKQISGILLNSPRWIQSVAEGDEVQLPIPGITDWMYAISNRVYGAFTVNLMRLRMPLAERADHDEAWGLDFGDPTEIKLSQGSTDPDDDHPMDVNMSESLNEELLQNPGSVNERDDEGWTLLHHQALAGSGSCVNVLLKHGADVNVTTQHGMTPLQLANCLGWERVAKMLVEQGAR